MNGRRNQPRGLACSFEGCGRPVRSRGLCQTHYKQRRRGEELQPIFAKAPARDEPTEKLGGLSLTSRACDALLEEANRRGVAVNLVITEGVEVYAARLAKRHAQL